MKTPSVYLSNPKRRLFAILMAVLLLLAVPLVAMRFTEEVKWSLFDFIVAGTLLLTTGLLLELLLGKLKSNRARLIACLLLFGILILVWAELAVGLFGTPFAGN